MYLRFSIIVIRKPVKFGKIWQNAIFNVLSVKFSDTCAHETCVYTQGTHKPLCIQGVVFPCWGKFIVSEKFLSLIDFSLQY